jgi:hypothetical protein
MTASSESSMNLRRPNPDCAMNCTLRNGPQCVCNLIAVHGENSPISHGLRIGLGHFYGGRALPPCIRGTLGAAYWSTTVGISAAALV